MKEQKAEVIKIGLIGMQVCVPKSWSNEEIIEFAEMKNLCGVCNGWQICKERKGLYKNFPEETQCEEKEGFVHIMLKC